MNLKKLILLQLTLFFGLAIMVACERNEESALSAAQDVEKDTKKLEVSTYSVTSTTHSINK
ncbi:hypothetical protein Fleli_1436 [Bernardetia litoralis DSM 6794]|uniref:Uncharacterized protein n=1 Tax=Bernardetia litoralis (strain ATCC 23117 / DSM 6794 / NBRC 15988 / NCIMB 1366 / Fx l1 / Sio-4) TaxID=880071 RepID=I4AIS8_BERLS|nr:hypothetical protein [Bernardetia litoralis]AFM03863.1 hypothetical protein Fleli_1436 [Bernardetia litoralis DSM 6794]